MIQLYHSKFLTPTKDFRRLAVLLSIHKSPDVSQHKIARSTCLSSSMVNNYIKYLKAEGLISISGDTNRTHNYHLTTEGLADLKSSLLSYSTEIVQLYTAVKNEIARVLNGFFEEGIRTIALFGVAETAEVVHAAMKETQLVLIGVVDSDANKHGKPFNGLIIQSPDQLKKIKPDAVLITSFARQEEMYQELRMQLDEKIKVKKLSDLEGIA